MKIVALFIVMIITLNIDSNIDCYALSVSSNVSQNHDEKSIEKKVISNMSIIDDMMKTVTKSNLLKSEYQKPSILINDSNRKLFTNHYNHSSNETFEDEYDYIGIGNLTIPEEFLSPKSKGFWGWIKKTWNRLTGKDKKVVTTTTTTTQKPTTTTTTMKKPTTTTEKPTTTSKRFNIQKYIKITKGNFGQINNTIDIKVIKKK
ncbi:uncharacterized protein LOC113798556 [Dermatophagoides pteronyssinus]|uniref:Uncharacterized protein LOC113798556 n=1 Tax=Dermatophagoides pteronyssinus TaxID=6956 RepID=A0A6P6YJ45_DERPT|nr:uncharacterized protein LOC113798556 [Dermatophagoides pteronyssinus]